MMSQRPSSGGEPAPGSRPLVPLDPLRPRDPTEVAGYRILGRLGSGGMGVAYLAQGPLGTWAVVKVMRDDLSDNTQLRTRLRREVDAMRRIPAGYAADVLASDVDADRPYVVMEFVAGVTVARKVSDDGPMEPAAVRRLAVELASALTAAHRVGVVHRDLKPGNLMLSPSGLRLIDFGIADLADATELTSTGLVVGSAGWLSPEQVLGQPVGTPCDVHAWAAVLVYAATGQAPFAGGNAAQSAYRIVNEAPSIPEDLPEDLRQLVRQALAKDPAQRPAAADLLRELSASQPRGDLDATQPATRLDQDAPTAAPATQVDPAPAVSGPAGSSSRGRRLAVWIAATVLGLLVGVGVGVAVARTSTSPTPPPGPVAGSQTAAPTPNGTSSSASPEAASSSASATSAAATDSASADLRIPRLTGSFEGQQGANELTSWLTARETQVVWLDVDFRSVPTSYPPDEGFLLEFVRDECPAGQVGPDGTCFSYAAFHVYDTPGAPASAYVKHGTGHLNGYFTVDGSYVGYPLPEVRQLTALSGTDAVELARTVNP